MSLIRHTREYIKCPLVQEDEEEEDPPPKSLIVVNVDLSVFIDESSKKSFEAKFRMFDQSVMFYYFRTFRYLILMSVTGVYFSQNNGGGRGVFY